MKYETAYLNRGEKNNNYKKPPQKKRTNFFIVKVVKHWIRLFRDGVEFLCLETVKTWLGTVLGHLL